MTRVTVVTLIGAAALCATTSAQTPGFTRTALQDQPISVPGHHGVTARVDIAAGVESGRHTHPGEEFGYVLEGALQLEVDGRAPQIIKTGEVFFVPAGVVHNGHNTTASKTTLIGTYVVEAGKPLSTPVK